MLVQLSVRRSKPFLANYALWKTAIKQKCEKWYDEWEEVKRDTDRWRGREKVREKGENKEQRKKQKEQKIHMKGNELCVCRVTDCI